MAVRAYTSFVDYRSIITIEPGKRSGKPCIRGMRITVSDVLDYLASGMSSDEIVAISPSSHAKTFKRAWHSPQIEN